MEFLLIAVAHFLALLSPGPDFFLILQTSIRMQLRFALAVCSGIAAANGCYLIIAVMGLEIVRNMPSVMLVLKYLGSGYLIYIGILLLMAPKRSIEEKKANGILQRESLPHQFMIGFLSAALNPKNAVFYLSLFTAMVSPQTPLPLRALYGLWMMLVVLFWDIGVAVVIGNKKIKKYLDHRLFSLEKLSGAMLSLFGLLLCFD